MAAAESLRNHYNDFAGAMNSVVLKNWITIYMDSIQPVGGLNAESLNRTSMFMKPVESVNRTSIFMKRAPSSVAIHH